jgi:hypothetical protein
LLVTSTLSPLACEEAKQIHCTRQKVLEAKEADRQNSKFYTKIKVGL